MPYLWVAFFGLAGVFLRWIVDLLALRLEIPPYVGTWSINGVGAFLAGLIYAVGVERGTLPVGLRAGIFVGFLGGFTTFSAYCLQTTLLLKERALGTAFAYGVLSPALGVGLAWVGLLLGRRFL